METEESDKILKLLQKGDKNAWKMLFQRFYLPLVLYAYRFLGSRAEAEDLVGDVLADLYENAIFRSMKYLRSYLYHTVHNRCINRISLNERFIHVAVDDMHFFDEDSVIDEKVWFDILERLHFAIEKLPIKTRIVFKAVVLEEKHYKDVALEQHISVNTVKTMLARAMRFLKHDFEGIDLLLLLSVIRKF